MTEDQLTVLRYTFAHEGTPPPYADPETEEQAKKAWTACNCRRCDTPCKYQNTTKRFPDYVPGGQGLCLGLIRAAGEPFVWINEATKEPCYIPVSIVSRIAEAIKERKYERTKQSKEREQGRSGAFENPS